jgi:hypothetical protein
MGVGGPPEANRVCRVASAPTARGASRSRARHGVPIGLGGFAVKHRVEQRRILGLQEPARRESQACIQLVLASARAIGLGAATTI